ncbi:MAG: 30S ribosomal protein S9, partial [Candidatus Vogelbacteria bacterium]|nr:30S ribosomal protein S9 [Candidatus Vogelbacteria bacterium]
MVTKVSKSKTKKSVPVRYLEAVGRRKTSVARVRLTPVAKSEPAVVNGRVLDSYFQTAELRQVALAPLRALEAPPTLRLSVKVSGGGISSQAGAVAHGLARALVKQEAARRLLLKKHQFLRRDSRMKERR